MLLKAIEKRRSKITVILLFNKIFTTWHTIFISMYINGCIYVYVYIYIYIYLYNYYFEKCSKTSKPFIISWSHLVSIASSTPRWKWWLWIYIYIWFSHVLLERVIKNNREHTHCVMISIFYKYLEYIIAIQNDKSLSLRMSISGIFIHVKYLLYIFRWNFQNHDIIIVRLLNIFINEKSKNTIEFDVEEIHSSKEKIFLISSNFCWFIYHKKIYVYIFHHDLSKN